MTLLGKVLTVLILVMSVMFMAFAVMVYATHTNWQMKADNPTPNEQYPLGLKQRVEQQVQINRQLREERDKALHTLAMEQAARKQVLGALQSKLEQVQGQLEMRESQLASLEAVHGEAAENLKITQTNLAQVTDEIQRLRGDLKNAQEDRDDQFGKVVALTDQLNQTEGLRRQLQERRDQLVTQVSRMKLVMDRNGLTVETPVHNIPPQVQGEVLAVSPRDLIEISIGSDDGLREGHELEVFRGGTYLGRVVIRKTDHDRAVAEILKDYRKGPIKKGDRVSTKLS